MNQKYTNFLKAILFYTILVILWGAWVRISHSGNGCGESWPLCHGQVIPDAATGKTWVELSHRAMSGLFGILILFLYVWSRQIFSKNTYARKWAFWSLFFTITEALLGAKLVLFGLVTDNDSPFRAIIMGLHFINSVFLVLSIYCAYYFSKSTEWTFRVEFKKYQKASRWALFGFLLIGMTGAIAALSNTLFPTSHLIEGLTKDFSEDSHYLLKLRILHPIFATLISASLFFALRFWSEQLQGYGKNTVQQLSGLILFAILFGFLTLFSLSPVWMKLTHLTIAHTFWIMMIRAILHNSYQKS